MSFTFLNRNLVRAAAVICTGLSGIAWAQAPASSLSLIFLEPTGVVAPTGSIPVNLRFTNNDPGLDFVVDSALPNGGLDASILPIEGQGYDTDTGTYFFAPYASYTSFDLTIGFGCSGNFTAPGKCLDGPPYTFEFASNPFSNPFTLAAGAHVDYLFGSFVPTSGPVAAGTYEFYRSVVWLNVTGLDADGRDLSSVVFPSSTCRGDSAAVCAADSYFTRVAAVPEPTTYALMGRGLALVGWQARRRSPARH